MYICDFSRSEGAGSATSRKTRGLTRSVIALIVPPLPAASRPSKTMIARSPLYLTHSWSLHSSPCSLRSSLAYFLFFIFFSPFSRCSLLIIASLVKRGLSLPPLPDGHGAGGGPAPPPHLSARWGAGGA